MILGAYFTQTLAHHFDRLHKAANDPHDGKEIFNVLSLFSHLYNFKVSMSHKNGKNRGLCLLWSYDNN
jgi:hypothetical protein